MTWNWKQEFALEAGPKLVSLPNHFNDVLKVETITQQTGISQYPGAAGTTSGWVC